MKRRNYKVWLLFMPSTAQPLWVWKQWMDFFELINPLVTAIGGSKTLQAIQSCDSRKLNLRPMAWTRKNMEKWAHHSPLTEDISAQMHFNFLEILCPSEKTCSIEDKSPDLFVRLDNDTDLQNLPRGIANQRLLIAIASDQLPDNGDSLPQAIVDICKLTRPMICFELNSPWIIKRNEIFTKSLRLLREFFRKDWDWNSIPSFNMFDVENTRFEVVASYTVVDDAMIKQLNFVPK